MLKRIIELIGVLSLCLAPVFIYGQKTYRVTVNWHNPYTVQYEDGSDGRYFDFDHMGVDPAWSLPVLIEHFSLPAGVGNIGLIVSDIKYIPLAAEEYGIVEADGIHLTDSALYNFRVSSARREKFAVLSLLPFRVNSSTGNVEKISGFSVSISPAPYRDQEVKDLKHTYAGHSVLASGVWFKLAFTATGVCKLSYDDLVSIGMDPGSVDPRNIRIYGNGGGMLPESNLVTRYDDLVENAITVRGESDGSFDAGDCVLFYVAPQTKWNYNAQHGAWEHVTNIYSDTAFYFLTAGAAAGKRIGEEYSTQLDETVRVNTFDDYLLHETDHVNLIGSGRLWFGEIFDLTTQYSFDFNFPGIAEGSELTFNVQAAARSTSSSSFSFSAAGNSWPASASPVSTYYNSAYASQVNSFKNVPATTDQVTFAIAYNKPVSSAKAWLDFVEVNATRVLDFPGGQLAFRKAQASGTGNVAQYQLGNVSKAVSVWDVTNPVNVRNVHALLTGTVMEFRLAADTIREFVAFDGNAFIHPVSYKQIPNQDLHAMQSPGLVIISPPVFMEQAVRLARHHESSDDLSVSIVTPETIYNEFSSGSPDVSAIRDFMKMFYDRNQSSGTVPYLLLFGDGSYDFKDFHKENTNYVLTFQSPESYDPVHSYTYDDYFGFLDDAEGCGAFDMVDAGIGRLPVKSLAEATSAVDKIIHYSMQGGTVQGDWRNVITFVADDEEDNEHMLQADQLASYIGHNYANYNIDKIYLDSYQQSATPSGNRYPDVNVAITQRIEKGTLIINYTGHGGETGWAHEEVLQISDINSWHNYDKMPVFVTATCEFSRYDDPERTSAGEQVFLNPLGGGIALFTTSRPTFGTPNLAINKSIYKYALQSQPAATLRMGDIIREAKREGGSDENGRKFVLLGDPALRIANPELKVVTTQINGKAISEVPDTISALSAVTVSGIITDAYNVKATDFNGVLTSSVFDKATEVTTLANDGGTPFTFSLQKNLLYKGHVEVHDGEFSFTFIVPRDISYRYGYGKISYYARSDDKDAAGCYANLVVGGDGEDAQTDDEGPAIRLYMNDRYFVRGGTTDENPLLLAYISDESGINTVGTGIGHDLIAILDDDYDNPYVLNDYYESEVNTYKSGMAQFPFVGLSEGLHTLTVRAWDVYNNSSEGQTEFVVASSDNFIMENAVNFPNPFSNYTDITFSHNQQGKMLSSTVTIFTLTGVPVVTLHQQGQDFGSRAVPVRWDGRTSSGNLAACGVYVYQIVSVTSDGLSAKTSGKLIYTR